MRHTLIATSLAVLTLMPASAFAQSANQSPQQATGLEQACITVAKNFLLAPVLTTGIVQSFPELTPPGARLTYSTRQKPEPSDFTNEIECEFDKAEAPYGLKRFCISSTCYSASEQEPERQRRYLEVKSLMDRKK